MCDCVRAPMFVSKTHECVAVKMNPSHCIHQTELLLCELRYAVKFSTMTFPWSMTAHSHAFYITNALLARNCCHFMSVCWCAVVVNGFEMILVVENTYKHTHRTAHIESRRALFNRDLLHPFRWCRRSRFRRLLLFWFCNFTGCVC